MPRKDGVIPKYVGKYRAYVADVADPLNMGRIRVLCPNVIGESLSAWCLPCVPSAYDGGGDFHYPKIGEMVWIEFEDDDLRKPIYTGAMFSEGCCPAPAPDENYRVISWGNNKILMEKDKMTITNGNSTVVLEGDELSISGNSNVVLKGKSISVESDNASMSYDGGEAGIDSDFGTIHISDNSIDIEHTKGSKVLLKDGSIDLVVKDKVKNENIVLSFTPEFIKHLKSL